jgi:hypothetical protein
MEQQYLHLEKEVIQQHQKFPKKQNSLPFSRLNMNQSRSFNSFHPSPSCPFSSNFPQPNINPTSRHQHFNYHNIENALFSLNQIISNITQILIIFKNKIQTILTYLLFSTALISKYIITRFSNKFPVFSKSSSKS